MIKPGKNLSYSPFKSTPFNEIIHIMKLNILKYLINNNLWIPPK